VSDAVKTPFSEFFQEVRRIVREEIRAATKPEELLTPEELAGRLKVPLSWVYEQSRQDCIPTHRMGKYIRFDLREILESQAYKKKNSEKN